MSTDLVDRLLALSEDRKRKAFLNMTPHERVYAMRAIEYRISDPWRKYQDDPVGFVEDGLKETLWSKQREILQSLRDNQRTAVVACHAIGKSHISARAAAWWVSVHPVGTARVLSTAPTFRQVRGILWAQIRKVAARHKLKGKINTTDWSIDGTLVADGFSPRDNDESAVQGIHEAHLLIIIDEAGGIARTLGVALVALLTGSHTRILAIGNPPTDEEGSWFEGICSNSLWNVITVAAKDTPNFTNEDAGICYACPPEVELHPVTDHLVDQRWVDDVVTEFGEDSAFVQARVHAQFPKQSQSKVIPFSWLEQAQDNEFPLEATNIRLGIDVASDGGDEFVIARVDGWIGGIVHRSSGSANANAMDVAGVCWGHILEAVKDRDALPAPEFGSHEPVRVKIDSIGVGWGVASILETWVMEQRLTSSVKIVKVNVAERPRDTKKFANQRAEMWWNGRTLVQPRPDGSQDIAFVEKIERKVLAQLSAPQYKTDSAGRIAIEKKVDIKKRLGHSPDHAEALLLAYYDPDKAREMSAFSPVEIGQSNPWA